MTRNGVEPERVKTPLPIQAFRMPEDEGTWTGPRAAGLAAARSGGGIV
ncbi:hypothetical protein [Streptomyces sp. B8F3]